MSPAVFNAAGDVALIWAVPERFPSSQETVDLLGELPPALNASWTARLSAGIPGVLDERSEASASDGQRPAE